MNSIDGAKELQKRGVSPDIIYIDACHWEDEVYADLKAYFPLVKGHGVLCGDDWNWRDMSVKKAVTRFAKEYNLKLEVADNNWFWILREKNLNKD